MKENTIFDARKSKNSVNRTTVHVQFLTQSKNNSIAGLKLTFDIKAITFAKITITNSYNFLWNFSVLLKPFCDER